MTSRRCDVLTRFLVCRGEGAGTSSAFLHLDVFSGRRRWFNHEASLDGRVLRGWSWRAFLERVARCAAGGHLDRRCILRSVVWRVYHERSDRRSQEQRNAARVREHPVHASISSPPCRLLSSAQGSSPPWHRECTIRYVRPSQRGGYNIVAIPFAVSVVTERVRWRLVSDTDVLPVSFVGTSRRSLSEFVDSADHERRTSTADLPNAPGLAPVTPRRTECLSDRPA